MHTCLQGSPGTMERWFTLVLIGTLTQWQVGEAQSAFTIDQVTLELLPNNTVDSGTDVTLRCSARVSHSASKLMHNFTFLLNNVVIYSKNTSEDLVDHVLSPARASNSGHYKCKVKIHKKDQPSTTQTLKVIGLQTPELQVSPSTVFEGEEITATCSALRETGSIQFFFYKNNQEFQRTIVSSNSVNTTMKMEEIEDNNLYCNYGLISHPDAGRSSKSNTVTIRVKELEMKPVIKFNSTTDVVEGDWVEISCNVLNYSGNHIEVFLTKNGILTGKPGQTGNFTYNFKVTAKDSGEYVCKSERGSVQKKATANLTVEELFSNPVLKMSPPQVFMGERFSLSCNSSYVALRRISHGDMKYSLFKGEHLWSQGDIAIIASQANNGPYFCKAEANGVSKDSAQLVVNAKVPVSMPHIRAVGKVIVGQAFQLECVTAAGTLPITYTLVQHQKIVASKTVSRLPLSALFNVSISSKNEINSFTCQVHNRGPLYSRSSSSLTAEVIETVSKPVLTFNTKGHTVTEGINLILNCSVHQGTPPISFGWYRTGDAIPFYTERVRRMHGEYTIKGITREQRGTYYCEATNDASETKWSSDVHIAVNLALWKKILIAVFCILLVVLITIILVISLKKAKAPRKRKGPVELSVSIKSTRPKSSDPMRISLTLDIEDNTVNGTPGVMGRNVWTEHVSDSESDDPSAEEEKEMLQYADVSPPHTPDDGAAPMSEDTDTVTDEDQDSTHGATEQGQDKPSLEYVQINHNEQEPE